MAQVSGEEGACEEMRLLVQADLDGELDAAASAVLAAHVAECPGCREEQLALSGLSGRMRDSVPRHTAPAALRQRLEADLLSRTAAAPPRPTGFRRLLPVFSFGAGAALAAGIAVMLLLPVGGDVLETELLASHLRALQPGHLIDVVSTDQHTVKPWFDGRLDFSPPVRDLSADGFPLIGGRLDYLNGRPVAVLVYGYRKHLIDVYIWPGDKPPIEPPESRQGYNLIYWMADGMHCTAISDAEPDTLARFVRLWNKATA